MKTLFYESKRIASKYFVAKVKEIEMAKKKFMLGMLAIVLVFSMTATGCATMTWNAPITESGSAAGLKTAATNAGNVEIARYSLVLGFIPLGQSTFQGLTVSAARSGKQVAIMRQNFLFFTRITAYTAKD